MPELPEVETIKRGLQKKVIDLKIKKVEVLNIKTFHGDSKQIEGKKVKGVFRRAKVLGIELENNLSLLFHLKMSGQVIFEDKKIILAGGHPTSDMGGEMPNRSTRVVFTFSDNSKLYFNDQRKFGWIKVLENDELQELNFLKNLGPEPLDKKFTSQVLKDQLLKRKNMPVKVAIMDQALISGVGNIYASEACFIAKIDPRTRIKDLKEMDFENLRKGIVQSLEDGIKFGGASRAHFVNAQGEKGNFLDYAYVYGRKGEGCKICKTPIEKFTQAGRGTYFCPKCQH